MDAEILATGSELLGPDRLDTNSLWLTERLNEVGVTVRRKTIVGDDLDRMREALEDALRRASLVICTGGLGPTEDDVTRAAAAAATGRPLVHVPALEEELRRRFADRGLQMAENNLRQASILEGAESLPNRVGTAPGIRLRLGDRTLALLPGPPREMKPMFLDHVLPELEAAAGGVRMRRQVLKVTGLTESGMDAQIAPLLSEFPDVALTVNFTPYDLEIRLSSHGALEPMVERLRALLGIHLFSESGEALPVVVARLLGERGLRLAVSEVASAGRLTARLLEAGAPLLYASVLADRDAYTHGWPEDEVSCLQLAVGMRRTADVAVVVGEASRSGERADAWIAVADAAGHLTYRARLPEAPDVLSRRASQVALDSVRRRLLAK